MILSLKVIKDITSDMVNVVLTTDYIKIKPKFVDYSLTSASKLTLSYIHTQSN